MNETVKKILQDKIIVIVRGVARENLIPLAQAIYDGGITLLECTYDATGKIPDEEIAENIGMLAKHFEGKMLIGAGTVLTKKQVQLTKSAGGKFIISPDTNEEIIRYTKELSLVSIPGGATPTEIANAHRFGADFVKVFPVNFMGGPDYIKTIKAPLSNVRLLAVNGVGADNIADYLSAGAVGFGIGSGIVNKKLIESGQFDKITELAKQYGNAVK